MTNTEIQRKNKAIWDTYSHLEYLENKYSDILESLESTILSSLPSVKDNGYRPNSRCLNFLMENSDMDLYTHMLSIYLDNCSTNRDKMLYGDIPAIVVSFSRVSLDYNHISGADLRLNNDGNPVFRGRRMEKGNKVWFGGDVPEIWKVLCDGRLIWCKDNMDSANHAVGWYFVLPLAAIDSTKAAEEMILKPLQVLLQGVNPHNAHIPISEQAVQFTVSNGVWHNLNS